jgi:hypothetical protein
MKLIKREQFYWDFNKTGKIPSCYEKIFFNNKEYVNTRATEYFEKIIYVSLVPNYLNCTLVNNQDYNQKKITHNGKEGAGILIDGIYTTDSFLQKFTKRKHRTNVNRAINRLQESFNITYEYNFGSITEEKYNILLMELSNMLEKRFQEKNMENMFLKEWELHTEDLFNLINQKKASLFVTYHDSKPISISLNKHIKNSILVALTNAYDSDYAKFSLGHLNNYLRLDWCLENKYLFLDLGLGKLDYKMNWCNLSYDCEYHLYSKKGSLIAKGIMIVEIGKIKLKNYLKKIKILEILENIKSLVKKTEVPKMLDNPLYNYEILSNLQVFEEVNLKEININNSEFKSIRKPIYDYLHTQKLHVDTIKTYESVTEKNTFFCKVGKHAIKISK